MQSSHAEKVNGTQLSVLNIIDLARCDTVYLLIVSRWEYCVSSNCVNFDMKYGYALEFWVLSTIQSHNFCAGAFRFWVMILQISELLIMRCHSERCLLYLAYFSAVIHGTSNLKLNKIYWQIFQNWNGINNLKSLPSLCWTSSAIESNYVSNITGFIYINTDIFLINFYGCVEINV